MPRIILKNIKGRHGTDGKVGDKGSTGVSGVQGPQGSQGIKGDRGTDGLRGSKGDQGVLGLPGDRGLQGLSGALGVQGPKGDKGDKGDIPDHEWIGESLKFQKPDGTWGKKVNLRGTGTNGFVGGGPSSAGVKYVQITTAVFTFTDRDLVPGQNIFGVMYAGDVTITIPAEINKEKIIIIKDESADAGVNNITILTQ